MPTKQSLFFAFLLIFTTFTFSGFSQDISSGNPATIPTSAPSTADVIRQRVDKAKAYIAVRNFAAAVYELENIKRETSDLALDSVINVLLMKSYLEQNSYKQAEQFLNTLAQEQKANKPNSTQNYFAVAAQVIRGAKYQLERYHSLGLNVSDRNLPNEAAADIENMRGMLELVVEQSKELGKNPKNIDTAMALLEGATNARSSLAKDDYDANRWRTEVTDAREMLASSRSTVIDAVNPPVEETKEVVNEEVNKPDANAVAKNTDKSDIGFKPVPNRNSEIEKQAADPVKKEQPKTSAEKTIEKKPEPDIAKNTDSEKASDDDDKKSADDKTPVNRKRRVIGSAPRNDETTAKNEAASEKKSKDNSPIEVGPLTPYATERANPVYPAIARNMRMTGVVKVEIVVDENGKVAKVQNMDGPSLLQRAASDAIKRWKFRPFERDGQPVKAIGYVSFNFSL